MVFAMESRDGPPTEAIAWVERTIGGGARVVESRRLTGGLTSQVHRLTIENVGSYVLRRYGAHDEYAARAVASETAVLSTLARSELPVPRVLGSTTDAADGGPAVLMTCLPGR